MKLKICGMAHHDNILQVANLQPDYLGFIFYDKSPRFFNGIIPKISDRIKKVGVFVNAPINEVLQNIKTHQLQAVQLHGNESVVFCEELKNMTSAEIIKVFSIKTDFNFNLLKAYESVVDFFLFDTKGDLPGGNGYAFNWNILNNYPSKTPYFLSGGIGLESVDELTSFFNQPASKYCHAIDVNSKFEIAPGLKNNDLLTEFISALHKNKN